MSDSQPATPVPSSTPEQKKSGLQALKDAAAAAQAAATPIVEQAAVAAATAAAVAAVTEAAPEVPVAAAVVASVTPAITEAAVAAAPVVTEAIVEAVAETVKDVADEVSQWFATGKTVKRGQVFDMALGIARDNVLREFARIKDALTDAEKAVIAEGGERLKALLTLKADAVEVAYAKEAPTA